MMAIETIGTGKAVPPHRVSNDDLAKRVNTNDEWIRSHTGIGARHIAPPETAASDLGYEAALEALEMAADVLGESPEETAASLDLVLVATATPDYIGCPSVSCIIQDRLDARNTAAMDISAGCTGFIYGMETARALLTIAPERKRALVIGAETLTKFANWDDRSTCVLFGDGSGAVVIEKTGAPASGPGKRGVLRSILCADGSGQEHIIFRRGGGRHPFKAGETVDKPAHLEMNGRSVYNFAVKAMTDITQKLLAEEGISVEEVARIIPHQANARIVQAAAKRLGIGEDKFFLNIEEYANTSAASIPIALDELNRGGNLKKGDLLLLIGFGGGLTYGGNLIVW
jgi:3-oxoacyl-[acyl-carrier-protein] synthase-3